MSTISEELDQVEISSMASTPLPFLEEIENASDFSSQQLNQHFSTNEFSLHNPKESLAEDSDHEETSYDLIQDESLAERLMGLTEMFPVEVRKYAYNIGSCLYTCSKGLYAFSCSATWLFFSSSAILFAPVLFELERAQMEEAQRVQQKQVLLGPNTAMSNVNPGLPLAPPVPR